MSTKTCKLRGLRGQASEVNKCPELVGYFGDWGTCPVQLLQSRGGVNCRSQKSRSKHRVILLR